MKQFKKIASIALALVLAVAMMVPAFADEAPTGSITVSNAVDGETYNAYRLLDLQSFAGTNETDAHAYVLNEKWKGFFTGSGAGAAYVDIHDTTTPAYVTWKGET